MSAEQTTFTDRRPKRRYATFAVVAVLVLCAGWTAIWFYARSVLTDQVDQVLQSRRGGPAEIFCADREISGFPFGMALSCSKAGLTEQTRALTAEIGGLKVGALAYSPRDVTADLQAPLDLNWHADASPLSADWSTGQASVHLTDDGPDAISTAFDRLSINTPLNGIAAEHTEFHARPADENLQTDMEWRADAATFSRQEETSAPFTIEGRARIDAPLARLMADAARTGNVNIPDLDISLTAGESRVSASGAISFNASGSPEGEIVVVTENLPALAAFLQTLPADVRNNVQTLVGGVIALSKPAKNENGEAVSELTLTLRDNAVFAGTRQIAEFGPRP
ncbi:MAG TPA: DUF2125 domain-containing protein [Afifellaceae bacterium]|nr:DUF2125 domain-containing protein [Afifellaceae bacterium]